MHQVHIGGNDIMINPAALMKLMKAKDVFVSNHPKLPMFIEAVKQDGIETGTIIELKVINTQGETRLTNIKVQESDLEMINELLAMTKGM